MYIPNKHTEPESVAKIKAWIPLVNNPKKIKGIGITKGTKETRKKLIKVISIFNENIVQNQKIIE